MKNLKSKSRFLYIFLVAILFASCHNILKEKELIVESISLSNV